MKTQIPCVDDFDWASAIGKEVSKPDPFSKKIRRYIDWNTYLEMQNALAKNSLISNEVLREQDMSRRIEELATFEKQEGFVYFGEKQWLQTCQSEGPLSYSNWAKSVFENHIFENPFDFGHVKQIGECWQASTKCVDWHTRFGELAEGSLWISKLQIYLRTNKESQTGSPAPQQLIDSFEVMHNLPYHLYNFVQNAAEADKPAMQTEGGLNYISVGPMKNEWYLSYRHDYGVGIGAKFSRFNIEEYGF